MLVCLIGFHPMDPARSDLEKGCYYSNISERMVILRCVGPEAFFHEKVIFPFEAWSFSCPAGSDVQIWTHGLGGAELLESFPASELSIDEIETPTLPPGLIPTLEVPWALSGQPAEV